MEGPIPQLIADNPTPAVVVLPEAAAAGYDPDTVYGLPGAGDVEPTVNCLFSEATQEGLAAGYEAVATFNPDQFPDLESAENCTVTILGVPYTPFKVRKRIWEGVHSGWTLLLKR